jgi:aldehyde:ferredoxin oxidoreductase
VLFPNKILFIDLTKKNHKTIEVDKKTIFEYMGGRGLGIYNLYTRVSPQINPFNPLSTFNLFCGPITGKKFFNNNRFGIFFKSPLTGIFGETYSNGKIAENLFNLGYIGLIIQGAANTPTWILINDKNIEFKLADDIWGLDIIETEKRIRKLDLPKDIGILSIGPAGEKLIRFAAVVNDSVNMAARCGVGAILGSKKIKSIVIEPGTFKEDLINNLSGTENKIKEEILSKKDNFESLIDYGELSIIKIANELGVFPTRYWKFGYSLNYKNYTVDKIISEVLVERTGCNNCPIKCKFLCSTNSDSNKINFPLSYDAVNSFGGLCDLGDIKEIVKMNDFCYKMGVDPSSLGNAIGFAIDNIKANRFESSTDLYYGNFESILEFSKEICNRSGDGFNFSDGVKIAAKKIGIFNGSIQIKGLEPIGVDPRGLKATSLSMGVCSHGASYDDSLMHLVDLFTVSKRNDLTQKHKVIFELENKMNLINSILLCPLVGFLADWNLIEELISKLFEISYLKTTLEIYSNRVITLIRHFNLREGISEKDDLLPKKFYEQPIPLGNSKGEIIEEESYETELKKYYQQRGFDQYGIPFKKSDLDKGAVTYYF